MSITKADMQSIEKCTGMGEHSGELLSDSMVQQVFKTSTTENMIRNKQ